MSFFYPNSLKKKHLASLCFVLLGLSLLFCSAAQAKPTTNPFPLYPVIKKNVKFWEKIYSVYSTSKAVVHDQSDLSKIYEVVSINDFRLYGMSGKNGKKLKKVKRKYRTILNRLAKGAKPRTKTERRVASMVKNYSSRQLRRAANNIRVQIGQKERFKDGVIRSKTIIHTIKKIFTAQGLPADLAYLPHVESSFNLNAYSKHGAAGIWQFTRSTGKNYLRIDMVIDERLDPLKSSRAAALFLKQNYNDLKQWPLAITAYNYGPSGMRRAVAKHGSYQKIFTKYNQGLFKFASRNFYSEFLAAVRVAKRLEKNKALQKKKRIKTRTVVLRGFINAAELCRHLNISLSTLKQYNPSLLDSVMRGQKYIPKHFKLVLPATKVSKKRISAIPSRLFKRSQKRSRFYLVKKGDTLSGIALRHKVSLKRLLAINNLKKSSIIYPGKKLRIPALPPHMTSGQSPPILLATINKKKQTRVGRANRSVGDNRQHQPVLRTTKKKSPSRRN